MKRNIVIATVAAAALIGGGSALAFAGSDDGTETRADSRTQSQTQRDSHEITLRDDDRDDRVDGAGAAGVDGVELTAVQAVDAALKAQPGTAVSAELDDEDAEDGADDDGRERLVWEVDVLGEGTAWHTLHVDAATGKIIATDTEDDTDDAREARAALKGATTTAAQAAEAAAAKGFVTSVDLDDDGRAGHVSEGWEIETTDSKGAERDWNVDVRTGKLTVDHDDRDDHRHGD